MPLTMDIWEHTTVDRLRVMRINIYTDEDSSFE